MRKLLRKNLVLILMITAVFSCKKEGEKPPDELVDPADANALTSVVVMPDRTSTVNSSFPASTGGLQTPDINSVVNNVITSNGSTAPFFYSYTNVIGNLAGFYVKIEGSDSYFNIPYTGTSGSSGQINLPIGIPTNVSAGNFCLRFAVYDINGRVSNAVTVCANVIRLGTGSLQVSLSWDKPTDQDLHVTDPSNFEIYFGERSSATGGELDRDDLDGYGPENIYWLSNAPDGEYKVEVHDYANSSVTNTCYVTVSSPGKSKSFTVYTKNRNTELVVKIKKNGTNYDY